MLNDKNHTIILKMLKPNYYKLITLIEIIGKNVFSSKSYIKKFINMFLLINIYTCYYKIKLYANLNYVNL